MAAESDKCGAISADAETAAAAHALAAGNPLDALNRIALRDDPVALALRGTAMAQLGDFARARDLLRRAARSFRTREPLSSARCTVAEAEVALASRDLAWPTAALDAARKVLEAHGDHANAAHLRNVEIRRLLLIGRLDEAEHALATLDPAPFSPALKAAHELIAAGIAMRRLHSGVARRALVRAEVAARDAAIPALMAEVESAWSALNAPAARLIVREEERPLLLEEVEALLASGALVVDACRHVVHGAGGAVSLATRPVLFALARTLAESWPEDVAREALVRQAFRAKHADESHRARLRVEIGRLRREIAPLASIDATRQGFALTPERGVAAVVLAPPVEGEHAAVLACLADGELWSSSALALALGVSQRTVQRALDLLQGTGKVRSLGRGRARRWATAPLPGFTTALLLPGLLPGG